MKFIKNIICIFITYALVTTSTSKALDIIGVKQPDGSLRLSELFVHISQGSLKKVSGWISNKKKPTKTSVELDGIKMTSTLSLNSELDVQATEAELKAFSDEINSRNLGLNRKYKINFIAEESKPAYCYIVIMNYNDKIIVSDIDGTVTKSDVRGHVLNGLEIKDWTHPGVAKLFTAFAQNGYKLIYLSARPMALIESTRDYIDGVLQDGYKLPEGPIITNDASILSSLYLEIIKKKPQEFKIQCLKKLFSLFAPDAFKYGIGNKETDSITYANLNLKNDQIFIINKQSVLVSPENVKGKTYEQLIDLFIPSLNFNISKDSDQTAKVVSANSNSKKKLKK